MTALNKQALRERYSPQQVPKCHICGAEMTVQRMSASRITYGCTGATYDNTGGHYAEGRSIADDHYAQSRVTVVGVSDPEVLALLDELEVISKSEWKLAGDLTEAQMNNTVLEKKLEAAEKRSAELIEFLKHVKKCLVKNGEYAPLSHEEIDTLLGIRAAGIGVKGE